MSRALPVQSPASNIAALIKATILAGMAGGILDILGAVLVYGPILHLTKSWRQVFQSVATGMLGVEAYDGGLVTAGIGLAFHLMISVIAAGCYVLASVVLPILLRRPLIFGHAFGVAVYFFMTQLIVPLSAAPPRPFPQLDQLLIAMSLNVFLFGVPIALVASRQLHGADAGAHGHFPSTK